MRHVQINLTDEPDLRPDRLNTASNFAGLSGADAAPDLNLAPDCFGALPFLLQVGCQIRASNLRSNLLISKDIVALLGGEAQSGESNFGNLV